MVKYLIIEEGKLLNIEAKTKKIAVDLVDNISYRKNRVPVIGFVIVMVPDNYDTFAFPLEKQARDFRHQADNVVAVADKVVLTGYNDIQESLDNAILYWVIRGAF